MSLGKSVIGSLSVLVGAGLVAGCGAAHDPASTPSPLNSATSSGVPAPAAPATYDIGRIGAAKGAVPAGFDPTDIPADAVSQQNMDAPWVGGLSGAAPAVVAPAQCAALLRPLGPVGVGARAQGFVGGQDGHMIVVMAAQSDKPAGAITAAGCDHITVTSPGSGSISVDRLAGPDIPGVPTVGLRAQGSTAGKTMDESTYTAALGDRTIVVVQGDVDPAVAADVLAKAVAAVRG